MNTRLLVERTRSRYLLAFSSERAPQEIQPKIFGGKKFGASKKLGGVVYTKVSLSPVE